MLPMFSFSLLLMTLFLNQLVKSYKSDLALITGLTCVVVSIPIYSLCVLYIWGIDYKNSSKKMIAFMQKYTQHKKIYMFNTTGITEFPQIDYADTQPAARIASAGWLRAFILHSDHHSKRDADFFKNMVIEDLKSKKPDYIFIDVVNNKAYLNQVAFNYLNYFFQYRDFKKTWRSYRYFATVDQSPYYKFRVYQRIAS